jgi:HlyD family secretion protein
LKTEERIDLSKILPSKEINLGDAEELFSSLLLNVEKYNLIVNDKLYDRLTTQFENQMTLQKKVSDLTKQGEKLVNEALEQTDTLFVAYKKLYDEKVISKQEFFDESSKIRQAIADKLNHSKERLNTAITHENYAEKLMNMQYEKSEREIDASVSIKTSISNIRTFIDKWENAYLITAPFEGRVFISHELQTHDLLSKGTTLFELVPNTDQYFAYIDVRSADVEKIEVGQSVQLSLERFPENIYGYLSAKVVDISPLPHTSLDSFSKKPDYKVRAKLSNGFITSYNKSLDFYSDLFAHAKIITKNNSLLEKYFAVLRGRTK